MYWVHSVLGWGEGTSPKYGSTPPRDVYRSGFCQNRGGGKVSRSLDQALVRGSEGKEKKDTKMRVKKSKNSEKMN